MIAEQIARSQKVDYVVTRGQGFQFTKSVCGPHRDQEKEAQGHTGGQWQRLRFVFFHGHTDSVSA